MEPELQEYENEADKGSRGHGLSSVSVEKLSKSFFMLNANKSASNFSSL